MEQDEIIEMAIKVTKKQTPVASDFADWKIIKDFAKLVEERTAAKEREACAYLCEEIGSKDNTFYREESGSGHCADAIRARSQADRGTEA